MKTLPCWLVSVPSSEPVDLSAVWFDQGKMRALRSQVTSLSEQTSGKRAGVLIGTNDFSSGDEGMPVAAGSLH